MISIVGGGPAGATLALRLARLGHPVTVIERGKPARVCDGESLNPGIWPLFDALAIRDVGGLRVERSLIRWSSDEVVERDHRLPQLAVMRSSFDARLLDLAREAGAEVVEHSGLDGFIVDASGRASWSRGARTRTSEPMLAMRALWRGAGLPREARVEALADGWIWGSPMPDGSYAAIACIDADADAGEDRYHALLHDSLLFRDLRGNVSVHCSDATTYAANVACDETVIRAGDASHSLDPLSSSGVRSAMQSALHASIVLNTMIRRPHDAALALEFYRLSQRAAVAEHVEWTRSFYAESRWHEHPFWRKRARPAAASPAIASDARFALANDVTIEEVPCVAGDFVERRRGIRSASARPFVWIGGVEAAPLLAPLIGDAVHRDTILARWRGRVPPGRELALFDAFVQNGVLTTI
jgi:flavin-dependent dehydrogenase